jgi:hypothetical protein
LRTQRLNLSPLGERHRADLKALFSDPGVRAIYGEGWDSDEAVGAWLAWNDDQAQHGSAKSLAAAIAGA